MKLDRDRFHPDIILFEKAECHVMEVAASYSLKQVSALCSDTDSYEEVVRVVGIFRNTTRLGFVPHLTKKGTARILRLLAATELESLNAKKEDLPLGCGCRREDHKKILELILKKLDKEKFAN